jgi:arylsulfatase A-like enzyme
MRSPFGIRRVVLVVLDGLRPDAIDQFDLHQLRRLRDAGASTMDATTVSPSITVAAMTSLLTGVAPGQHGLTSDRFHIPRAADGLSPLPRVLREANYPTSSFIGEIPLVFRGVASRIARQLGVTESRFAGRDAPGILLAARNTLATQRRGLIVMHWPDADRAGHAHGWMSREYGDAAQRMDATLGLLIVLSNIARDPGTMLVLLSDHGGGGVVPNNHESDHPLDRRIWITVFGLRVVPCDLGPASLLDVPATILWTLGVHRPSSYAGRALCAAFEPEREPEPAIA